MEKSKQTEHDRLLSLDFFRGLTMFLLVVAITGFFSCLTSERFSGTFLYAFGEQFEHHPWNGLRFWDLIQPFFMFIVGVAMPFSYAKRIGKGESHSFVRNHILIRCLILLLLGWWLYCIPYGRITFFFQNVLAQLSVTILLSFLVMRKPVVFQVIFSLILLILSDILYRVFPVEGFNQPFTADHNFGAWLDMHISGELSRGHWVSFNAVPTTAHTIWGVLAGKLLMGEQPRSRKVKILIAAGIAGLILGFGLNPVTPIIKRIATSTFVLASGGWTFLALALSFWLIDVIRIRWGIRFFAVVGMNPLFIYLFAEAGGAELLKSVAKPLAVSFFQWAGPEVIALVVTSVASFLLWLICYLMYRHKIFIKI
jgi:predicted acyltransferase